MEFTAATGTSTADTTTADTTSTTIIVVKFASMDDVAAAFVFYSSIVFLFDI